MAKRSLVALDSQRTMRGASAVCRDSRQMRHAPLRALISLTLYIVSTANSVSSLFRKGEVLKAEKRYHEAIEVFEAAAQLSPLEQDGLKARVEVGRCIFAAAGDAATPASELGHYQEAIRLAPRFGAAYVILAHRLCARNRPSEAVTVLRTALGLGFASPPLQASLYQVLGFAYFTMGNTQTQEVLRSAQFYVGGNPHGPVYCVQPRKRPTQTNRPFCTPPVRGDHVFERRHGRITTATERVGASALF